MWQLDNTNARLDTSRLRCQLDVAQPQTGLRDVCCASGEETASHLMGVELWKLAPAGEIRLADCYVRGRDLVATYDETSTRPFRTQVYWRYVDTERCYGLELIVSVQTSQWLCEPALSISSLWPEAPTAWEDASWLCNLRDGDLCYAELVHPSNCEATEVVDHRLTHIFFVGQLEKGVIRRARLRGLFIPADGVPEIISQQREQFLASAPPLTT